MTADAHDTETLAEVRLTDAERKYLRGLVIHTCSHNGRTGRDWCCAACHDLAARIVQARAGEVIDIDDGDHRDRRLRTEIEEDEARAGEGAGEGALRERIEAAARVRAHLDAVLLAPERVGHYDVGHDDDVPLWSDDLAVLAATPGDPEGGGDRG